MCLNVEDEFLNIPENLKIWWLFSDTKVEHGNWVLYKEIYVYGNTIMLWKNESTDDVKNRETESDLEDWKLAYAIQTSGTTGQPKIVKVPHKCIVPNIQHLQSVLSVTTNDVIFLAAPSTFDPSIVEMFLAFSTGAVLLIVPRILKSSPNILLKKLFCDAKYNVTVLEATPSFVMRWPTDVIQNTLFCEGSSLRVILLGGEQCPSLQILRRWKLKGNNTDVFNIYGITEVSCWATIHKVEIPNITDNLCSSSSNVCGSKEETPISSGDALSQTLLSVRSNTGEVITHGEGELYIGSMERICLINDETVQDLQFPVYRATGDMVKVDTSSREIVYIGRKNNIVKRFGHRVSMDHVEQIVNNLEFIDRSICVWNINVQRLGLFVKLKESEEDNQQFYRTLRSHLLKHLHPSSIPDVIINLETFPLTCHGKLDRQTLKHLIEEKVQKDVIKLSGIRNARKVFSTLWSECLCLKSYPYPHDDFLKAGGNSILALQLVSQLEEVLGTSARTNLVGLLLAGSTFEECCSYLCSISSTDNKLDSDNNMPDTSVNVKEYSPPNKSRKRITNTNDSLHEDSVKHLKLDVPVLGNGKVDINDTLIASSCRGKTEESMISVRVCVLPFLNDIKLKLRWKYDLGKCVDASPRVLEYESGAEMVLVGSHSHLLVILDGRSADMIAQCNLSDRIESSMCASSCGKFGIVGSYDGCVYCIELCSGHIKWYFRTEGMVKSSPVLCLNDSAIAVGSYDQILYCINIVDGELLWSAKVGAGSIYSSPCISAVSKAVFAAALDGTCGAYSEVDGRLIWNCKLSSPVFSSPSLLKSGSAVLFAEVSGKVHCFSEIEGTELWNFQTDGNIFSSFSIQPSSAENNTDLIMFGCHNKKLYCLEGSDSAVKARWTMELDASLFSVPFIFPIVISSKVINDCEIISETEKIYFVAAASTSGKIYLLELDSGTLKSSYQLPGEVFSSPVVNRNNIYVGCRDNNVYSLAINAGLT
ncbi:beta-alanine-activating enzyme isoform X2 [Periplaneta americana]